MKCPYCGKNITLNCQATANIKAFVSPFNLYKIDVVTECCGNIIQVISTAVIKHDIKGYLGDEMPLEDSFGNSIRTSQFKDYRRTKKESLRTITEYDINNVNKNGDIEFVDYLGNEIIIYVSKKDKEQGSPKIGDMVLFSNNKQYLVSEQDFDNNYLADF